MGYFRVRQQYDGSICHVIYTGVWMSFECEAHDVCDDSKLTPSKHCLLSHFPLFGYFADFDCDMVGLSRLGSISLNALHTTSYIYFF
jgi:hypothetical protein